MSGRSARSHRGLPWLLAAVLASSLAVAVPDAAAHPVPSAPRATAPSAEEPSPAAGVTATASSSADTSHSASRAVDGRLSSSWRGTGPHGWLEIDLGRLKTVTAIRQTFARTDVWNYKVEGSVDHDHWATLLDKSTGAAGQTFGNDVSGVWRYVRLVVRGSTSSAPASSEEFVVHADSDGTDLALGKPATASSAGDLYEAAKAVDGDTSTYWGAASATMPQSLTVDLQAPAMVTRVEQNFKDDDTYEFRVDGSRDGKTWTGLLDDSDGARGTEFSHQVEGIYRYVRLTITGSASGFWAGSTEFGVYGFADVARGRTATASTDATGHAAGAAADGDRSTYWSAGSSRRPQRLTLDLGGLTLLRSVRQSFVRNAAWTFVVSGSVDGRRWTTLADARATAGRDFAADVDGAYRYVRLVVRPGAAGAPASSRDIAVYGAPITRNLAQGVSATTSSLAQGHPPQSADDGDAGTAWRAENGADPQWLMLDLGNRGLVSGVRQTFATRGSWSFTIEASTDQRHWQTVLDHRRASTGRTFAADVHDGTFRYVRLTVMGGPKAASSSELQVFGIGSPVTDRWWDKTSGVRKFYINYYHDTLPGIEAQLDSLRSHGYGAIELTTLPEGWPQPFAGLGALHQYKVDPHAGTMADLKRLLAAAHRRGLRVLFFGNLGYASDHTPAFLQAAKDFKNHVDSDLRSWFMFDRADTETACKAVGPNYSWSDVADVCYYQYWGDGAPAFNFASASWRAEAQKYLKFWMGKGMDAMILDAEYVYLTQRPGQDPQLIDAATTNSTITSVLQRYDAMTRPEGGACCGHPLVDPIVSRNFNTVQWYPDTSVLRTHNPDGLEDLAKTQRDPVVNVHGVQTEPPSWDDNAGITPAQRLLEFANITTTGSVVYLDENFSDLTTLPQTKIIPTWPKADQQHLWALLRAQNAYQALGPTGARVKLPTNDNSKYYAYVRSSKQGGVKALTVLNYQPTPQKIAVQLTGSGIATSQQPVDLVSGRAAAPITSGTYTITLPAYGSAVLGVNAGESARAGAEGPTVGAIAPDPVDASAGEAQTVSTTVTNPGADDASDVSARLDVPAGWTATPVDDPATIAGGATVNYSWQLVAAASTPPGAYQATLSVSYEADGVVWIAKPRTLTLYLDATPVFSIGVLDGSDGEFALAPGSYGQYPTTFPNDVDYTIGTSTPAQDWSFIQPGPADPWAGSREHPFTITYTLSSVPDRDLSLTLAYADTHPSAPPTVQVSSNGTAVSHNDLPAGGGGGAFGATPQRPCKVDVVVPRSSLHAGSNTLTVVNTANSWSVFDVVQLLQLDR